MYTIIDNKNVSIYDELLTLGAHCNQKNKLIDSKNKEVFIFQPQECANVQKSDTDILQIKDQENQEIKRLQQSSTVIVLVCQIE